MLAFLNRVRTNALVTDEFKSDEIPDYPLPDRMKCPDTGNVPLVQFTAWANDVYASFRVSSR
jgi:hypothetical protein